MRTWSENDPKARLMARKRDLIVDAALAAFLDEGYAGSSVNRIAADAGVSITTLYRHFSSKDDLFIGVIQAVCATPENERDPAWVAMAPSEGLREAGRELLRDILSERQLALFRVLARDARRFPELGRRYREEILGNRVRLFVRHVKGWPAELRAKVGDPERAAHLFASLVRADVFETALLGGPVLDEADQRATACRAAADLLALVDGGRLAK